MLQEVDKTVMAWSPSGKGFYIFDKTAFSAILPTYFGHNRWASFQKQLILYNIRIVRMGQETGSFAHPLFRRGHRKALPLILRNA